MKQHSFLSKKTRKNNISSTAFWGIFSAIIWELCEDLLENLIANTLTNFIVNFVAKILSVLAIITITKGVKVFIQRSIQPIVKTITYKEGKDKMNKIKSIFKFIYQNKCSLGGILIAGITALSGTEIIDVNILPALVVSGFNITPYLYYAILGAGIIVCSLFFENEEDFKARVKKIADSKLAKKVEKAVQKKIAENEKEAKTTEIENEKQSKANLKKQIKEEKEKQFNELVEARMKELQEKITETNTENQ